jgi:hypothetical protein
MFTGHELTQSNAAQTDTAVMKEMPSSDLAQPKLFIYVDHQ